MTETPEPMAPPETTPSLLELVRGSQMLRLMAIGALVLLLQLPIAMIRGVIEERAWRRGAAVTDVQEKWGGEQRVAGPRLVIPVTRTIHSAASTAWNAPPRIEKRALYVLPDRLEAESRLDSETLHRGIFQVPVYQLGLTMEGTFSAPDLADLLGADDELHWERAALVIEISEARAIQRAAALQWGDESLEFLPGGADAQTAGPAIHVLLGERAKEGAAFNFALDLNGSEAFYVAAAGKDTLLRASSNWPDPSFQGAWLPNQREIGPDGFTAEWRVPNLGRNLAQIGLEDGSASVAMAESSFGLRLATPVDTYRMAERSAKYATLFLLLTFGTLWLFEILAGARVHSVQYLLVGGAMCLFYLLETSLAEHIGFGVAYILASAGVIGLIAAYAAAVLGGTRRAGVLGGVLVALYGYLYVLLTNQDYALLAGSIGLFLALGAVMFLTRRVKWGDVGEPSTEGLAGSDAG
jgi:inner membrane protein